MRYTRDHQSIPQWATRNGAVPAEIRPVKFDGEPAVLYFLTGDARSGTEEIHPIGWDDFFARFELMNLWLSFDESTSDFELCKQVEKTQSQFSN